MGVLMCSKCGIEKDISQFHKNRSRINGVQTVCSTCRIDMTKKSRQLKREFIDDVLLQSKCHLCGSSDNLKFYDKESCHAVAVLNMAKKNCGINKISECIKASDIVCMSCYKKLRTQQKYHTSNEKKANQLGMKPGAARHKLVKMIIFDMATKLGLNKCYRCGELIKSCDDLSIDHKIAWLDNDINLYWDLNNITFSHKPCNSRSTRRNGY